MRLTRELYEMALDAPEGVTRLDGDDGGYVEITREPHTPGVIRVDTFASTGSDPSRCLIVPAAAESPAEYPSDVPFLADLMCMINDGDGRRLAVWMDRDSEVTSEIQELSRDLGEAQRQSVDEGGSARSPEEMRAVVETLLASFKDREKLDQEDLMDRMATIVGIRRERFESMMEVMWRPTSSEDTARFDAAFDAVVAQSRADGWRESVKPDRPGLREGVQADMRRDGRRRFVCRQSMFGVPWLLLLEQDDPPSA